jgi:hypothetical protein
MAVALAGLPWRRPRKRSSLERRDRIRRVRDVLRRIEIHGPREPFRAELVLAVRRLLAPDFWDDPLSAA